MFEIDAGTDPPDLHPGDVVTTANEIRAGDVVCFERTGPTEVTQRALTPDEQATYGGPMYRIDRAPQGHLRLRAVAPPDQAS